ncbi:MAG: Outer membrane protein assembly factor BamB [SAR92 bacterium MED-G29]|jgi:outer membrane protein assembly factor BamB|nr:MAG: Outer membrane protein assembly factor BamB [SAR92 bacterium MED-G29]|tara:strand:+ start:7359 stop:8516 length:1158 start_codon:yes stop_codon:yes gene_type:complete
MKHLIRLTNALLCTLLLTGCSYFGGDEDDAAITPAELVKFESEVSVKRLWSTKIGSGNRDYWSSLRPVASSDTIFAGGHEGNIVAVDIATGKKRWAIDLEVAISGGVGYAAGQVMVGTIEGDVYSLNAADGSINWTAKVSSEILSSPKSNGEVAVVQTVDNKLFALDAATGEELWQHDGDAPILTVRGISEAIVTNNMVLSGFDSGKLIAFNPANGSLIWESRLAVPKGRTELERMVDIDGQPLLVGDVIYSVTYQGRLGALSRGTGRSLWFQDSSSHFAPAHSGDKVFVTEDEDRVRAFKAGSGQVLWSNDELFLRRLTGPAKFAGTIAVVDAKGFLHLLDPTDGHFVGREKVDGSGVSAPLLTVGNRLIVQANSGSLSAYELR